MLPGYQAVSPSLCLLLDVHEEGGHGDGWNEEAGQGHQHSRGPAGGHEGVALSSSCKVGDHLSGLGL